MAWFINDEQFCFRNDTITDLVDELVKLRRQPIGDHLCHLITLWGEIYTGGSYANYAGRDRLLGWAVGGRVEEFVSRAVCRETESSARALRVLFRVAAIREVELTNGASYQGIGYYNSSC